MEQASQLPLPNRDPFSGFGGRFTPSGAPACVFRTASVRIWRSSAFVFGGARVIDACH
jgi:hypothetical protein